MDISVKDTIGGELAITAEDGDKVRVLACEALLQGQEVTISLAGLKHVITLFLNSAVGALYDEVPAETVDTKLRVIPRNPEDERWLKVVMDRARSYYTDPEARRIIDEVLDEEHA